MKKLIALILTITALTFVGCDSGDEVTPTPPIVDPTPIPDPVTPEPLPVDTTIIMESFKTYKLNEGDKLIGENTTVNLITVVNNDGTAQVVAELVSGVCKIETTSNYEQKVIVWEDFDNNEASTDSYSIRQSDIILVQGDTEMDVILDNEGLFSTVKIIKGSVTVYRKRNIDPAAPIEKGLIIE